MRARLAEPPSREPPSVWCEQHVIIPPPQTESPGPLSWIGREYLREPLDSCNIPGITDVVLCFGAQAGKTTMLQALLVWLLSMDPSPILWVMPSETLGQSFSETRLIPILRATPSTAGLIPVGSARHAFKVLQMQLGGSVLNIVGTNSASNLSSRPVRVAIMDEVDKFNEGGTRESDAVGLVELRTKKFSRPLRVKTSTPTIPQGLIWGEYTKGDQRRYFLPCPHCRKDVLFAWSKQYTTLPLTGSEAYVRWDPAAKRDDGTWDLRKVAASAHAVCPHCEGKIRNDQKTAMLRAGRWQATSDQAAQGFRSYHLSSLYAIGPQTSFGALAVKFLQAKASLLGLHGFINGDLAEPYVSQETIGQRVELITAKFDPAENDGWVDVLTVDCQARGPAFFWWIHRQWHLTSGESRGIACGPAATWEEIEDIQKARGIKSEAVAVDSGWGARSEAEVYATCAQHSVAIPQANGLPLALGWMPTKGYPGRRQWREKDSGIWRPFYVKDLDPFEGSSKAGLIKLWMIGFSADYFKDVLAKLRQQSAAVRWSVTAEMASDEYWRHMDGEYLKPDRNTRTGRVVHTWVTRGKDWPNHWFDCEVLQLVVANFLGLLTIEKPAKVEEKEAEETEELVEA